MRHQVLIGDAFMCLYDLPSASVDCAVTSPPYFGLRDYGVDEQIGREECLELYLDKLLLVFDQVHRVLKADGTLWVNMGDSYSTSAKAAPRLKPKDLIGVPWALAFALRDAGWWLRSDIIWAKPNPMPQSVTDRPSSSHEYIFLLSKSERYYYDAASIRENSNWVNDGTTLAGWDTSTGEGGHGTVHKKGRSDKQRGHGRCHAGFNERWDSMSRDEQSANGRNKRSVWTVATRPFPEAHFATFPEQLIEPCILAGCPEGGTVLDPFLGSGTTLAVAKRLGRNGIGIELNPEYAAMAERRIADAPDVLPDLLEVPA